jgi:hypothetical protein
MTKVLENGNFILKGDLIFRSELGFGDNLDGKSVARLLVRAILDDGKGALAQL